MTTAAHLATSVLPTAAARLVKNSAAMVATIRIPQSAVHLTLRTVSWVKSALLEGIAVLLDKSPVGPTIAMIQQTQSAARLVRKPGVAH